MENYYKRTDYHNAAGYNSPMYGLTYYDGYGYNYYTGDKGYYEFSRPPLQGLGPDWNPVTFFIYLGVFTAILGLLMIVQYRFLTAPDDDLE